MTRRVSIVVWFDATTDPPVPDGRKVLVMWAQGSQGPVSYSDIVANYPESFIGWAELPVLSDLTDDDVLDAAQHVRHSALSVRNSTAARSRAALSDRLRAALGGEKEET